MASCGFAEIVGGVCGCSCDSPLNVQCVMIGSCTKDIQGHLGTHRVFGDSLLDCEAKLILARAGKKVHISYLLGQVYRQLLSSCIQNINSASRAQDERYECEQVYPFFTFPEGC